MELFKKIELKKMMNIKKYIIIIKKLLDILFVMAQLKDSKNLNI